MKITKLVLSLLLCIAITSCQNVTPQENESEKLQEKAVVTHTLPTVPVADAKTDITEKVLDSAALQTVALADNQDNLLTNNDFEQGVNGWYACTSDQNILPIDESNSGNQALELTRDCFYQSVLITDSSTLSVSCFVNAVESGGWTGMGLSLSDTNWQRLADAPVQTVMGSEYHEYGTSLSQDAIPSGSTGFYATLWIYTDSLVLVDDCAMFEGELGLPEDNLLTNANFSNGQSNWSACSDETLISTEAGTLVTRDGACVYQTVNAREDLTYTLNCKARVATPDTWNTLILSFLDENWTTIEQAYIPLKRDTMRQHLVSLRAPENSRYAAALFYSEGEAVYDNCDLSVETEEPEGANLIKNGGFEEGLNHWELCGDIDFVSDDSKAHEGNQAVLFNAPEDAEDCIQQTFYAPVGGKSYLGTCWTATYDSATEGVDAVDDGMELRFKSGDNTGGGPTYAPFYAATGDYDYVLTGRSWGIYITEPTNVTFRLIGTGAIADSCVVRVLNR